MISVSTCRETWRWRLKCVEICVSVSWYKNVNRKIVRGYFNIYLANRVLLEDWFISMVDFLLQVFRRGQIYWYWEGTSNLSVSTFERVLFCDD